LQVVLGKAKAKGVNPYRKSGVEPLRRFDVEFHHLSDCSCGPVVVETLCPASLLTIAAWIERRVVVLGQPTASTHPSPRVQ